MRKTKRRKPMAEINVVPYIDVTLVLLIIFMITTPMLQTGVEVDLPKAESANVEVKEGKPPIIIHIYKEHKYEISVGDEDKIPVELEDINERVAAIVGANKDSQVLIAADGDVDYRSVVKVMASLKNAGVPNVGLMTQPEDD
jgi:biopolymer transport protein TolR